jgi:protein ImuB
MGRAGDPLHAGGNSPRAMRTYVRMIVCVSIPRFELATAVGGSAGLIGCPVALAPESAGGSVIGEPSGRAEALGVRAGMRLGEALARAPQLVLVAADPVGVAEEWERVACALEGIGAELELERPGVAYFEADGLYGLYDDLEGVMTAARTAVARPVRLGAGPTRFCAFAASKRARAQRAVVIGRQAKRYLAGLPIEILRSRNETASVVKALERLGLHTLGDLACLPRSALADRFGQAGMLAHCLASGEDLPLVLREIPERVEESLELEEAASGLVLQHTVNLLVDRLLARVERRGRTFRSVVLSARLVDGGTWREEVVFRQALADSRRIGMALSLRLDLLPGPVQRLWLRVVCFGPPVGDQHALMEEDHSTRRRRLREAVNQIRAVAGPQAALRILWIDPGSRVPERRAVLTPFPE